jgi:hypothetical protein
MRWDDSICAIGNAAPIGRAYPAAVEPTINESTESLLEAYRADLQGQLRLAGIVERLSVEERLGLICLVATVRVGSDRFELLGSGEGVVEAYTDLLRSAPESVLSSAYRQVVEP